MARSTRTPRVVQREPLVAQPQANLTGAGGSRAGRRRQMAAREKAEPEPEFPAAVDPNEPDADGLTPANRVLIGFLDAQGDISDLLTDQELNAIGQAAIREMEMDDGTLAEWRERAEESLRIAAQEADEDEGDRADAFPFADSADINYPMLTVAAQQWAARASPELIRGDKVVGVKAFQQPGLQPSPQQLTQALPPPGDPATAQQTGEQAQQEEQTVNMAAMQQQAKEARAKRVAMFLNWSIFYKMDDWEGETDQLLNDIPIIGAGFKKVWMSTTGLCSEYVSALKLIVSKTTKNIFKAPRISQVYEMTPNEIVQRQVSGKFRYVSLPIMGQDPEAPRELIEQHRLEDLDGDGFKEPYIVTVDRQQRTLLRIEPAFSHDDVLVSPKGRVLYISRYLPFSAIHFLKDPRGGFYGIGFGRLLASVMDAVDSGINQTLDASTAANAGGGFIGSNVRLQGGGQGGVLYFEPGEYQVVSTDGAELQSAVWERTLPQASPVTFQLIEMLLGAAKDIASVKDVVTGDSPATAPVGTTMAVQAQALTGFSAIYKRVWRGFSAEFRLMFQCVKRYADDRMRDEYKELTGGDLDADFAGDGTDLCAVGDPSVVTKVQKMGRVQALLQLSESPTGMAAGMQQPGPAQELIREAMEALDVDRPDRFFAQAPPNPEAMAKTADIAAAAKLKQAQAAKAGMDTTLIGAKTLRELALAAGESHSMKQEADRLAQGEPLAEQAAEGEDNGQTPQGQPPAA